MTTELFQIALNPSKQLCLSDIAHIPSDLPALYGWKDIDSRYMGISDCMVSFSGLRSRECLLGKTDFEIAQFHSQAESYMEWDRIAMKHRPVQVFEKCMMANGEFVDVSVMKFPIYQEKTSKIIGVFYYVVPSGDFKNQCIIVNLSAGNKSVITSSGLYYKLKVGDKKVNLTEQESMLLYYYLRGRTSNEIALSLGLSRRTIDAYLDSVKEKLSCRSRYQVVDLVIENGLFEFMPKKMITRVSQ